MKPAQPQTYARLVRTISILGTASLVSVVLGVAKMKAAALILGPVGIGIIALLQNAVGVATTLGDMGMRQSGAREISRDLASGDRERTHRLLVTLCWMGVVFALLSSAIFYGFRDIIADRLLGRPDLADELAWSTAAVAATVLAAVLTAILNGHHRVREITRVTVFSALFSCVISVGALWLWRPAAITVFVVSAPMLLLIVSLWYVVRMGALPRFEWPAARNLPLAGKLLKLGVFVMLSAIVLSLSELAVRLAIQRETGLFELGLFSAAWALGVYYLNFLMVATSTEFFPRLSSRFDIEEDRNRAINLQIQAMCLIAAPVVIGLSAFCPLVLQLLYSSDFLEVTHLVRLMVIGDVFRLSIYPLGFVLIAASHGRSYFGLKSIEAAAFTGLSVVLLPRFGLSGVGLAHIATFTSLFAIYYGVLAVRLGFRLTKVTAGAIASLFLIATCLAILAAMTETGAVLAGIVLLAIWAWVGAKTLLKSKQSSTDGQVSQ